ncbi:adenylate/guanylate cyclase domain-containing protein [Bradyrhizobium sp. CCGUVB23]|uniref:ATP-binding protein n=1 Tax=Bradyrhizobium sp. CCGUVB23 TaxID=2949630 RepID=UPI0020B31086|nr:adenylate/guanylate cyclase domain-containing protein [Bradyrhizobium sp. CCGUVB23]MCP3462927.1 AAA family ATPase [Bradyrhizobium sp. CCGUVB23]
MDLRGWLRRLGLEQYEAAFRENAIDDSILPSLTAEDLKDLGVGLVGHRRKLLDAIAALRAEPAALLPLRDSPSDTRKVTNDAGERRQVTVMFSDLVGSTALSTRMDPEDLREVISAYQTCVADTVRRYGGFVAKYMGDGALIYFGYPHAHEDDAERTVRAALTMIAAVDALKLSVPLQTRVGIATGLVVVGDLVGSGEAQERSIVGETPNLAARLQAVAEPNTVVVAETTRRLLGNLFDLRDLRPQELKGISEPVRAFAVLQASSIEGRFEAMHPGGLTELVGRAEELELLLRRWARAKSGEGHVVLLSGEAGIGKSRLSAALMEGIAAEPHTRLRYFCSPQHTDSAFYPIIGQFQHAAGYAVGDTPQTKLDKLDLLLAQSRTSRQDAALLAEMLSLPNDGRFPALELAPEQQRQKTLEALGIQLKSLARSSPVLMIVEDAHWGDPTSLEAFGRMVDLIARVPVLMIVTFRPEFEAPWTGQPHVTALALNRLGYREVGSMIDRVVGDKLLPADFRTEIIERTDGIPLFVEEMTKAVLEAGGEWGAVKTAAAVPSPALAVPASLHASLMARLDRLGTEVKAIAQIGAAIGREFSHFLLAAVASRSDEELKRPLEQLVEAGLVFRQGSPSRENYVFKHALVRDAAYGTLLRPARRELHLRIARVLEQQRPDVVQGSPESLAHHYTEAGALERAAALWGAAGRRSHAHSALAEAEAQLSRALGLIGTLPSTPSLRREQIALQVELLTVLMHTKGYGAEQTKAAAERARVLIQQAEAIGEPPEDSLLLFSVIYGFWVVNIAAFNGDAAHELAYQFMQFATKQPNSGPLLLAHRMMGVTLMSVGIPATGKEHLDQAIALFDATEHRALATRFGTDAQVAILEWRSRTNWLLGFPLAARRDANRSFICARDIDQAATLMHALAHSTATLILLGDLAEAGDRARELVALADDKGSSYWSANGLMWQGCLMVQTDRASEAVHTLVSSIETYHSTGATIYVPFVMSYLAMAHSQLERHDQALDVIDRAIAMAQSTKEQWCEAELYRTKGKLILRSGNRAAAEADFERALDIARRQQARSWELRAATSMARLWRDQGKRDEARDLLAPVYNWFIEGFDTDDLKKAKVMVDTLAS